MNGANSKGIRCLLCHEPKEIRKALLMNIVIPHDGTPGRGEAVQRRTNDAVFGRAAMIGYIARQKNKADRACKRRIDLMHDGQEVAVVPLLGRGHVQIADLHPGDDAGRVGRIRMERLRCHAGAPEGRGAPERSGRVSGTASSKSKKAQRATPPRARKETR